MKKTYLFGLLAVSLTCLIMGLASPLLVVSSRVVVGIGRFEFPAVDIADTLTIPQTVYRLAQDGELLLMLVVLLSCIIFPALKLAWLSFQALGRGTPTFEGLERFFSRWSLLEILVLAVFVCVLKADKHLEVRTGAAVGWLLAGVITSAVAHWLIERKRAIGFRPALAALLAVCLPSCGKPSYNHHIKLRSLEGVQLGSSVMWKGAEIGTVTAIGPDEGKLKVTLSLHPGFSGYLREGVVAEPATLTLPMVRGRIMLVGGDDPNAPALASGTELPVKPVSLLTDSLGIAKDYLEQGAAAVQQGLETGSKLMEDLPEQFDDVSNAAADSLEALAKRLRK